MANKTISVPEEIDIRLKQEDNASGLITQLLCKYYEVGREMTFKEIEKEKQFLTENLSLDKTKLQVEYDRKMNELDKRREELEHKEAQIQKQAEDKEVRIKTGIRKSMVELFDVSNKTEIEIDLLAEEYYMERERYPNIYSYMEEKEIRPLEDKEGGKK